MKKVMITVTMIIMLILTARADLQDLKGTAKTDYNSAKLYYRQQIYEKALPFYEKVLQENPYHIESLFIVSGIYYEINMDYWTAYDYYTRTLGAIEMLYDEYAQLQETDTKAAGKYFRKYIKKEKIEETESKTRLLLAHCLTYLYKTGYDLYIAEEYEKSLEELNRLYLIAPDSVSTVKLIANSNLKLGNIEEAIAFYEKAYVLEPDNVNNASLLANQYFQLDKKEKAVIWYQRAADIVPEDADNYFNMGICYTDLGDSLQALNMFAKSLEYEPDNIDAIFNARVLAQQLKDIDNFLKFSQLEFDLTGYDAETLKVFCFKLNAMKAYEAVLKYSSIWSEIDPENPQPIQLMISAANKLDRKKEAAEYLKKLGNYK